MDDTQYRMRLGVALIALWASAGCTCEVKFGAGASEAPTPSTPPVTQIAAAVEPVSPPVAAAPLPVAEPAMPEPTGVLSEASVRKAAARHRGEVLFCMEQEKTSAPPSLRIQFVVKPGGSVDNKIDVLERSEMPDRLASCLVSAVKRWSFEPPKGGPARATLLLKK